MTPAHYDVASRCSSKLYCHTRVRDDGVNLKYTMSLVCDSNLGSPETNNIQRGRSTHLADVDMPVQLVDMTKALRVLVPVPRGSFAMGTPQPAKIAPPRKCGELGGNRLFVLGKLSGACVGSCSGSPRPTARNRCILAGTA